MSRTSRTRSRTLSASGVGHTDDYVFGTYLGSTNYGPVVTGREVCDDSIGNTRTDSSFFHRRGRVKNPVFNGSSKFGFYRYNIFNVPENQTVMDCLISPHLQPSLSKDPIDDLTLGTMAIASMNPSQPDIGIGQDLAELHELPELLRDAGRLALSLPKLPHPRNAARANIIAQFGILPIVSDLWDMLDFVDLVARREQVLRDMTRGYRRFKRKLTSEEWNGSISLLCGGVGINNYATAYANIKATGKRTYWFSARAKLTLGMSEREIQTRAWRLVLGIDPDPHQLSLLWELLPWSWLIDWFTTTGLNIRAFSGGIPWDWEGINVMYSTTYDLSVSYSNLQSTITVTPQNVQGSTVTHYRNPTIGWALPRLRIPYLTANQLSILGSLITLRI